MTKVTLENPSSQSMTVSWPYSDTRCDSKYHVWYTREVLWGNHSIEDGPVTETSGNTTILQNLTPYSEYTVCVFATTEAGRSGDTCDVERTLQDSKFKLNE